MTADRYLFFLLACTSFAMQAQIRGRVLDPSGTPVARATVTLVSRDNSQRRVAETGAQGSYEFSRLGPAQYLLTATAANFAPSEPAAVDVGQSETRVDLTLALARVSANVSVTASATAQSADEISKAFDTIDADEIGRRAEFSLTEALRLTPGIRVMQLGGPGSLARVHTRGLRAFDTSLLIDGFRFRDSSAPQGDATGFLADVLLVDAERIEVLRGSGSSLYGTNAMGGVVNLVSAAGGGAFHGDILAEGGGFGMFRSVARLGGGLGERIRYSAGLAHLNVTRGLDGDDRARNSSAQGHVSYALSARSVASARVFANDSFAGLNGSPYAAAVSALPATIPAPAIEGRTFFTSFNDPDSRRVSRFHSALLSYAWQASPNASVRANYQLLGTRRDNRDGPGGARFQPRFNNSNLFEGRIDTAQVRADLVAARRHFIAAGYEFEREDYDNLSRDPETDAQVRVNQRSHALFAQDQIHLAGERLRLSLSGRVQGFDLSRPVFRGGNPRYAGVEIPSPPRAYTGDAALSYFLRGSGTKLRAHAGNAYRAPTLYERFGYSFFAGSFSAFGDPRIAPERSVAFDAGVDQYFASSRVRVSGTYFYTRLQQVIGFDFSGLIDAATDPYGRSSGYRTTGGGLARGVEVSAQARLTRTLFAQGSYTHTNADERTSVLLGGSVRSIRVSKHMATALLTQRFGHGIDVTVDFFGASDYLWQMFAGGNRPYLFAGPKKADVVASYTRPWGDRRELRLFARVENVFNRSYYEDGFRTPKAWAVGGIKVGF